jgi:1-acyl-sn-glycerol-3-phosphate acyltransferase
VRLLRIVFKGGLLAALFAFSAALAAALGRRLKPRLARLWMRAAAAILGLRVRALGAPTPAPALYAANHVSWIEVVALGTIAPFTFVAKDDVARWPVVGTLASAAGTLFLKRGSAAGAARAVGAVVERLAAGERVAAFPEGTSTCGDDVLPFKPSLFEAAARLGCDVQPVAVRYPASAGRRRVAPFIGDDEFLPHLLRVLAEPGIDVELTFAAPISAHGRERGELAAEAWSTVTATLDARRAFDKPRALAPARAPAILALAS